MTIIALALIALTGFLVGCLWMEDRQLKAKHPLHNQKLRKRPTRLQRMEGKTFWR